MRKIWRVLLLGVVTSYGSFSFSSNNTITFDNGCTQGTTVVLAAVGDVLLHSPLQRKAEKQGFESLWEPAIPFIQAADIAYANLEGPMAKGMKREGDYRVYSSFPYFNYNPDLAISLKKTGFDIVSTANNHILDRFSKGIDKTLEALDKVGLFHVGARPKSSNADWVHIHSINNLKIGFIACTETTNDNPDNYQQVLYCYKKKDRRWIIESIQSLKNQVDALVVLPHWGEEYQHHPTAEQIFFAHQVLDAGATAVIGSHPHVLQPLQKYITKDQRETLIMYSLGNFVSNQGAPNERSTIILYIGLTKNDKGTLINGVRFVPLYMQNRSGDANLQLRPLTKAIAQSPQHIISRILPMGNALYSLPVITNPECFNHPRRYLDKVA